MPTRSGTPHEGRADTWGGPAGGTTAIASGKMSVPEATGNSVQLDSTQPERMVRFPFVGSIRNTVVWSDATIWPSDSSTIVSNIPMKLGPPPTEGFLGFSTDVLAADVGLLSMNSACVAAFGKGARMCFTTDFSGQTIPFGVTGEGWTQPVLLHALEDANKGVDMATGSSVIGSCGGWRTDLSGTTLDYRGTALLLQGEGGFNGPYPASCSATYSVACCRWAWNCQIRPAGRVGAGRGMGRAALPREIAADKWRARYLGPLKELDGRQRPQPLASGVLGL